MELWGWYFIVLLVAAYIVLPILYMWHDKIKWGKQ